MPIRKLPPLLINQIAAGEVIERPASVVKELVENSLDAGATRIDVAIEEGGLQLIRVSDDGGGIVPEELPLAIAAHATSKLHEPEDLASVATLGFRGEALASMASVSRLRITSRARIDGVPLEAAAVLEASGDAVGPVTPASGSPGTIMEVRDLFFNTPARRKFMRSSSTEFGHIAEIISRLAMVRYDVAFTLTHNGRKTLDVPIGQTRRERCVRIIGKEMDEALLEFQRSDPSYAGAEIWGLAGLPAIARATAKFQYICLNGRPIKDRNLTHAIKEAYRGLMPMDQNPVAVVFIELSPEVVDVNVHPAKSEVRFREPGKVHSLVLTAIRQRLLGADLTPSATAIKQSSIGDDVLQFELPPQTPAPSTSIEAAEDDPFSGPSTTGITRQSNAPLPPVSTGETTRPTSIPGPNTGFGLPAPQGPRPWPAMGSSHANAAPATPAAGTVSSFVDYFRKMDPRQKGFVYEQVKAVMVDDNPNALLESAGPLAPRGVQNAGPAGSAPATPGAGTGLGGIPLGPVGETVAPVLRTMGVLQVHKSYLVTQDEQGLLIIDQHALHERVMFEELRQRVLSRPLESQRMLMPAVIPATARRQAAIEQLTPLLEKLGIEVESFGPDAVAVQAFPSFLFDRHVEVREFMEEMLDKAEEGELDVSSPTSSEAALHEVLDMMACKAAVKAGDHMSPEELAALLTKRDEIERSSNCPHGRPTTLRMTLRDLEKQFKRG